MEVCTPMNPKIPGKTSWLFFNGDYTRFFIDGNLRGTTNISPGGDICFIGNTRDGNQHFSEYLDDFRIYGKSLNETEVAKVYNNGIGDAFFNLERNGTLRANAHDGLRD